MFLWPSELECWSVKNSLEICSWLCTNQFCDLGQVTFFFWTLLSSLENSGLEWPLRAVTAFRLYKGQNQPSALFPDSKSCLYSWDKGVSLCRHYYLLYYTSLLYIIRSTISSIVLQVYLRRGIVPLSAWSGVCLVHFYTCPNAFFHNNRKGSFSNDYASKSIQLVWQLKGICFCFNRMCVWDFMLVSVLLSCHCGILRKAVGLWFSFLQESLTSL